MTVSARYCPSLRRSSGADERPSARRRADTGGPIRDAVRSLSWGTDPALYCRAGETRRNSSRRAGRRGSHRPRPVTRARSLVWFRRDLRVEDHPALCEAASAGSVAGVFVVDPAFRRSGADRRFQLGRAVADLDRAMGGALVVRTGDPVDVIPRLAAEAGAHVVYVTRDGGPYGRRRDRVVGERLARDGRRLRGVGWPYAVGPGHAARPDGAGYRVFTPYRRAWGAVGWPAPLAAPDVEWRSLPRDDVRFVGLGPSDPPPVEAAAARDRWEEFVAGALDRYRTDRNRPGRDGTSRLSSALRWGTAHPRQLLADLGPNDGHRKFEDELCWREFYADVLVRSPDAAWHPLDRRFASIAVDTGPTARRALSTWSEGRTGFPLVDAGMRQLSATGWMHNRVRMVAASFLVKDLHLPWQWGARFFLDHLVDGDLASNQLGWQWVAGCGTDAAPYHRVLNPSLQLERFDPDGEYVRAWIPELRDIDGESLRRGRAAGTRGYPAPMIDHAVERAEALARYGAIADRRTGREHAAAE